MRQAVALLAVACVVAAAAAAGATARATRTIVIPLHGTVAIANTDIRCGAGRVRGITFVDCGIMDPKNPLNPKKGSYLALMTAQGRVTIAASSGKTVFSRQPASVDRRAGVITAHVGDTIVKAGTSISCNVGQLGGKADVLCFFVDKRGVTRPSSYSFVLSQTLVTAIKFDKARKAKALRSFPENG